MSDLAKERPILFSGPMVNAILEGRKTQTRRVLKVQPNSTMDGFSGLAHHVKGALWRSGKPEISLCPYGQLGDRLWVRETFVLECDVDGNPPPFDDGRPIERGETIDACSAWRQPHYRATDPTPELDMGDSSEPECKWTPSIFMPRWASRITLELVKVRVERVQEISEADVLAEGVKRYEGDAKSGFPAGWQDIRPGYGGSVWIPSAFKEAYRALWDSINKERGFGWDANPWVWVVEFKRIDSNSSTVAA